MNQNYAQAADQASVTDEQVADYLLRHGDFFDHHPDLLEQLRIPHPTGNAVSLVAKQIDLLRERNRTLQQQLGSLVEIARTNDTLSRKIHRLALALFEAQTLDEVLTTMKQRLNDCFTAEYVAIWIIKDGATSSDCPVLIPPDHEALARFQKVLRSGKPNCGHIDRDQAEFLFGEQAGDVRSCAIVPLRSSGLRGLLAIGSQDKTRFHPGMGHLFLSQMEELVSCRLHPLLAAAG